MDVRYAERITIATFIKLLIIKIVANSKFGFSNNFSTAKSFLFSFKCSISLGLNEKKATSVPEIKADAKIKAIIQIAVIKKFILNKCNFIPEKTDIIAKMEASSN